MKSTLTLLILYVFGSFTSFTQKEIDGTVSAGDSVAITVNYVTPVDDPNIEVLFKAEDLYGYPYWGLEKEHVIVREELTICDVVSLRHLSDQEPINIVLVVDHSSSMAVDESRFWDKVREENDTMNWATFDYEGIDWESPEVQKLLAFPLEDAKTAINKFIPNFNATKDRIGLVTFNHTVSKNLPLGTPKSTVFASLQSLDAEGGTAFFDAVLQGIENLKDQKGINVVIALTDGMDGSSQNTPTDIIKAANETGVMVYCVGLGNADNWVLTQIADSTDGYYAKAENSAALDSVYQVLERKIRAFYLLEYSSKNWSSDAALDRGFTLRFKVQEINDTTIPEDVVAYLNSKSPIDYLTYSLYGCGGILIVSLLSLGVWQFRKRRPKKLEIVRTFPNPGNGHITLTVKLPANLATATVQIYDHRGNLVHTTDVQDGENKIDIHSRARGFYEIILSHPTAKPAQRKYLKNY